MRLENEFTVPATLDRTWSTRPAGHTRTTRGGEPIGAEELIRAAGGRAGCP